MILTTSKNVSDGIATSEHIPSIKPHRVYPRQIKGPDEPTSLESGVLYTFILDEYTYYAKEKGVTKWIKKTFPEFTNLDQESVYDNDKNNINWALWIRKSSNPDQEIGYIEGNKAYGGYIRIEKRELKPEYERDFLIYQDDPREILPLLESYAYTEAEIDTFLDSDGITKNRLRIRLSKWLNDYIVGIEPFRNSPGKKAADFAYKGTLKSQEIVDIYWSDFYNKKITCGKYNSEIYLTINTIGFTSEHSARVSLFYELNGIEYSLNWSDGVSNYTYLIEDRFLNIPLVLEDESHQIYSEIQTNQGTENILTQARIEILTADNTVVSSTEGPMLEIFSTNEVRAFLADKEILNYEGDTSPSVFYHQLNEVDLSSKTTLVVEAPTVPNGEIMTVEFYSEILQESGMSCATGGKVPLIDSLGNQTNSISVEIQNGRAEVEIQFQSHETPEFIELDDWLSNNPSEVFDILIHYETSLFQINEAFELKKGVVVQKIYHDGRVSDTKYIVDETKYVQYEYYDVNGTAFDLGTFELTWIKKWKFPCLRQGKLKPEWVSGVDYYPHEQNNGTVEDDRFFRYDGDKKIAIMTIFSGDLGNKFLTKTFDSIDLTVHINTGGHDRRYFTPKQMGALIGAIKDSGLPNVTFTGCIESKGKGEPSKSHVNGNGVDFRLIRKDGTSASTKVYQAEFDAEKTEILIDSFKKFGYVGDYEKKYYSSTISNNTVEKYNGILLKDCKIMAKHEDHLHILGFKHGEGFVKP